MFDNISYKKKLIGLLVLFVVMLLAANKRSFRATRTAYHQMNEIRSQLEYLQTSAIDSRHLETQLALYDNAIGKQNVEWDMVQQSILEFATQFESVAVDGLSETHLSASNGFEVITYQLTLEGSFYTLTNAIYAYERQFKMSKLVSVNYTKEKSYNDRKDKLKVQLIFQNYEKSI